MSLEEAVVEGTLNPDGTLELDQKPNLAPGRVTVVLRPEVKAAAQPHENWFQFMRNVRKKMEESGCHFMDEKGMQTHIDWLREGDRIDDLLLEAGKNHQNVENS